MKGHTHLDLGPLTGFRLNLELPTQLSYTFSHAWDSQTHFVPHLFRIETPAFVTYGEQQSVSILAQINLCL